MAPQRKVVGPPTGNNAPVSRGAGGQWSRRLPGRNCAALLSGSFENWALGPDPYSGKEWGGASGKALALAELGLARRPWSPTQPELEAATPTSQRLKMQSKAPRLPQLTLWHEISL